MEIFVRLGVIREYLSNFSGTVLYLREVLNSVADIW